MIGQKKIFGGLAQRAYSAKEIYEGELPEFRRVSKPQPGDICADGKHVGIVSGKGKTISASEKKVVENDWGFRKNAKRESRFYRYVGKNKKKND